MSSTSRPPNASTSAAPPDPALITSTINRLRAEHDAATTSASQAILLHEIGVLSEALGDEAAAAREQLGAVNVEPDFREPLERLIAIISQRQSYKNLGKLLERLVRVADAPEERARALLAQAAFQADQEQDLEAARATLEEAVAERPEDAAGWLALEVIAGRLGDDAIRLRALAARTGLTQHPTWRALLLVDLASGQLAAGDAEAALESLDLAIEQKSGATYLALAALEELGQREDRNDVTARALEAQAALVLRSLDDASTADALGIPRYKRTLASAADALLRAAEAQRRQGNLDAATRLLDQALERLPDDPSLLQARMSAADAAGDTAAAARIAKAAIERGTKGARAAAMWLRVAEGAAAEGNGLDALEAADKALAEDPGCIPARALELDLLAGGHDPSRLTSALEACAEQLPNDEAKARYYLLAADAWARLSGDVQGARAALSQAGMYGASPGVVARVARMLAGLAGDAAWYEEATRRLLAAGATDAEHASLGFELGARAAAARRSAGGGKRAFGAGQGPARRLAGARAARVLAGARPTPAVGSGGPRGQHASTRRGADAAAARAGARRDRPGRGPCAAHGRRTQGAHGRQPRRGHHGTGRAARGRQLRHGRRDGTCRRGRRRRRHAAQRRDRVGVCGSHAGSAALGGDADGSRHPLLADRRPQLQRSSAFRAPRQQPRRRVPRSLAGRCAQPIRTTSSRAGACSSRPAMVRD